MVCPQAAELGTEIGQFIHKGEKRCLVRSKAEIDAKPCEQCTGVRLPVRHRATMIATEKHQPNDIALGWGNRSEIAEHLRVGGIPGGYVEAAVSSVSRVADAVEKGLYASIRQLWHKQA